MFVLEPLHIVESNFNTNCTKLKTYWRNNNFLCWNVKILNEIDILEYRKLHKKTVILYSIIFRMHWCIKKGMSQFLILRYIPTKSSTRRKTTSKNLCL